MLATGGLAPSNIRYEYRSVNGGLLVQTRDDGHGRARPTCKVVTKRQPTAAELDDLLFAWQVCKYVKSNAIVYAKERMTIGVGAGQMSRVVSSRIAAMKAKDEGLTVAGAVMASDAFFPFRDGLDVAAEFGIKAVIQPGGSMRDNEVIAAADEHGMAMVFTGHAAFPALSRCRRDSRHDGCIRHSLLILGPAVASTPSRGRSRSRRASTQVLRRAGQRRHGARAARHERRHRRGRHRRAASSSRSASAST